MPLLKLIDSRNGALQHNSAFAIYGLADNEVELIGLLFNLNFLEQSVPCQSSDAGKYYN